jgi:hypothetical protein
VSPACIVLPFYLSRDVDGFQHIPISIRLNQIQIGQHSMLRRLRYVSIC